MYIFVNVKLKKNLVFSSIIYVWNNVIIKVGFFYKYILFERKDYFLEEKY